MEHYTGRQNIIIVDDHKMFIDGLLSIFETKEEYSIVLTAYNAEQVLKYLEINKEERIDLIITDIGMPEVDGIVLNKMIKKQYPAIKTLVVSTYQDGRVFDAIKKQGADGYVPKNAEKKELLTAVETIINGGKYFSSNLEERYKNSFFSDRKHKDIYLTDRERDVLTLIAKELTTQEIADTLCLSKHTIESYRKTLISKLKVRNLAGLVKYAIKIGLVE